MARNASARSWRAWRKGSGRLSFSRMMTRLKFLGMFCLMLMGLHYLTLLYLNQGLRIIHNDSFTHVLHLNIRDKQISDTNGINHTPTYWTPFHRYMEKIKHCKKCPRVHKWEPYFAAYTEQLSRFRGRKVVMMEVGVQSGGSMMMWRSFFGCRFEYYGIDINPQAQQFASEWATIFIGDQGNPEFWKDIKKKVPVIDIFLDDGGHNMSQQFTTFEAMFPHVKSRGGVYVCEDLSTSYSANFLGQPLSNGTVQEYGRTGGKTFVELSKKMIDWLNCYFVSGDVMAASASCPPIFDGLPAVSEFKQFGYSLHFYSQIIFIQKERVIPPFHYMAGGYSFPYGYSTTVWDGNRYDAPAEAIIDI
ncbi:methyltransferase-like protein [Micromonas pusilla CCMP1545]|uniref:Methyltransferase-like protein n=1 Tax=Micromonas pusilla (strain CCMP1545) TaxID=564608 RepID=C1NAF1_MICPC|nr:methyltransferase-like protein [Micromonas pusilla CCMP1545]EEH50874.1 methyltransferase-like protein [Micromonas pusilla CCMP1545]|eukprot:XP_003064894.1 methyltransferase-like protein [Micromonas pusilla CCMP1545]